MKHTKIIQTMSMRNKLELLISNSYKTSGKVTGFKFPMFHIEKDSFFFPIDKSFKGVRFLSDSMLSNSWDKNLIYDVFKNSSNQLFYLNPYNVLEFDSKVDDDSYIENAYYKMSFLKEAIQGINDSDNKALINDTYTKSDNVSFSKTNERYHTELLNSHNFQIIKLQDAYDVKSRINLSQSTFYFGDAKTVEEIVSYLNKGASFVFYVKDNFKDALDYVELAASKYQNEEAKMINKTISYEDFLLEFKNGEIINPKDIDEAVDKLLTLYGEIENANKIYQNDISNNQSRFNDVVSRDLNLDFKAEVESIVLLKNENSILPLERKNKVAVIGDWFKNKDYYPMFNEKKFTSGFEIIDRFDKINYTGYAHGYLKDNDIGRDELIRRAIELSNDADISVIYLYAFDNENCLDVSQRKLINTYINEKIPFVAIVNSDNHINIDFADSEYCRAILYVERGSINVHEAVLSILAGVEIPSARLSRTWYSNDKAIYPFGHGLTFGHIEYENLVITPTHARFTVKNLDQNNKAREVVQLYVRSLDENSMYYEKQLRGFATVELAEGESQRIEIPFEKNTFTEYIPNKKCYGTLKSKFEISVGRSADDIRQTAEVFLNESLENEFGFNSIASSEEPEQMVKTFIDSQENVKVNNYKKKKSLLIIFLIYFDVAFLLLGVLGIIGNLVGAATIFFILFSIYTLVMVLLLSKLNKSNKKLEEKMDLDRRHESLPQMISDLTIFSESGGVNYYRKPKEIEPFKKEEEKEEFEDVEIEEVPLENVELEDDTLEIEEDEPVQEETPIIEETPLNEEEVASAELTIEEIRSREEEELKRIEEINAANIFTEEIQEDEIVFDETSSLQQMCLNFGKYCEANGLFVEQSSIRALFGALSSSKIIILNSKLNMLLPKFVGLVCDYLGDKPSILEACDSWVSPFSLCWKKDADGNYVKTDFVSDVFKANKFKTNLNLGVINNVNMKNLDLYFDELIDFALHPTYKHVLTLNKSISIKIPENICFILIANDEEYLKDISENVARSSISIEILLREGEVCEYNDEFTCLSNEYLSSLAYESKKSYFLSEESWKKLDELVEVLNRYGNIKLGNKIVLQVEKYSSVYLNAGGDELETLDAMISDKVVPIIFASHIIKSTDVHKEILEAIDNIFESSNMPKTIRLLNSVNIVKMLEKNTPNKKEAEEIPKEDFENVEKSSNEDASNKEQIKDDAENVPNEEEISNLENEEVSNLEEIKDIQNEEALQSEEVENNDSQEVNSNETKEEASEENDVVEAIYQQENNDNYHEEENIDLEEVQDASDENELPSENLDSEATLEDEGEENE